LGDAEVPEPIEICLAGRAFAEFRGARVPVDERAVEASGKRPKKNI